MLDNKTIQPSKFSTKNSIKIHDDSRETHNTNRPIKLNLAVQNPRLCFDDTQIFDNGNIAVTENIAATGRIYKQIAFKN